MVRKKQKKKRENARVGQAAAVKRAIGCTVIAAIVNQLVRIVNKSLFYNSAVPHRATLV